MQTVSMQEARSSLSRLVKALEQGRARQIVITRHGRPVAMLLPIDALPAGPRIGIAKGKFEVPDNIDADNEEVARLFLGKRP